MDQQTNSPNPLAQVEKAYEKDIKLNDIFENPVLKPISDISSAYKSQSLTIAKQLSDYDSIKSQIDDLIELNPRYSSTIIVSMIQRIIYVTTNIIHNQDIQRAELKKAMNEVLEIVQEEYCRRQEGDMVDNTIDVEKVFNEMLKEPELKKEDKK